MEPTFFVYFWKDINTSLKIPFIVANGNFMTMADSLLKLAVACLHLALLYVGEGWQAQNIALAINLLTNSTPLEDDF